MSKTKREAIDDLIDAHVWLRSKAKRRSKSKRTGASGKSPTVPRLKPLNEAVRERLAHAQAPPAAEEKLSVEQLQRRARENWLALKAQDPDQSLSIEAQQRRARERWREYQQSKCAESERGQEAGRGKQPAQERERPADRGINDDLSL
jgi:hypothetical protein